MKAFIGVLVVLYSLPAKAEILYLFMLSGQSNMTGTAIAPVLDYPAPTNPNNIYTFRLDVSAWQYPATPNVQGSYVSPAYPMADRLITLMGGDMKIGLVPCAQGGTYVSEWQPGETFYVRCKQQVQAALASGLCQITYVCKLQGIYHWQGEADAHLDGHYDDWVDMTINTFSHWRSSLAANAAIVYVRLGPSTSDILPDFPKWDILRANQPQLKNNYPTRVRMTSTDGVCRPAGNVHYTTAGYVAIGEMSAGKFYDIFSTE